MAGDDLRMIGVLLSGSFPGVSTIKIVQRGYYKASWYILRTQSATKGKYKHWNGKQYSLMRNVWSTNSHLSRTN